jgi:hypothetical protein
MEIDKNALVEIIAALGARADKVPGLEGDNGRYYKWWREEEGKVTKLRQQLRDADLDPVV